MPPNRLRKCELTSNERSDEFVGTARIRDLYGLPSLPCTPFEPFCIDLPTCDSCDGVRDGEIERQEVQGEQRLQREMAADITDFTS